MKCTATCSFGILCRFRYWCMCTAGLDSRLASPRPRPRLSAVSLRQLSILFSSNLTHHATSRWKRGD